MNDLALGIRDKQERISAETKAMNKRGRERGRLVEFEELAQKKYF